MSDRKHFASKWNTKFYLLIFVGLASLSAIICFICIKFSTDNIASVKKQDKSNEITQSEELNNTDAVGLKTTKNLIKLKSTSKKFDVSGKGLTVAVLGTGLRDTHKDFVGRVKTQLNFTSDNKKDIKDASDGNGNGTHLTGIIAANGGNTGIAPKANIIPIKVLDNDGNLYSTEPSQKALDWIIKNRREYNITAVYISFGGWNYTNEKGVNIPTKSIIKSQIKKLKNNKIAVIAPAGDGFDRYYSKQGMAYPAIIPETISVGAIYDAQIGFQGYDSGAYTEKTAPEQITPFSQRLHSTKNQKAQTDIFAPGVDIKSSGINDDDSTSIQSGTGQAAAVVTGVVLLLQEYHLRKTGYLPSIDNLTRYLRDGGVVINDGDDEIDNVKNTGLNFTRIHALGALEEMDKDLR